MNEAADERFMELPLNVRGRIRFIEDHWYWVGKMIPTSHRRDDLYGGLYLPRGQRRARSAFVLVHRYVYELLVGPIPEGFVIDHLCGEKLCCRPSHLEAVTIQTNSSRVTPQRDDIRYPQPCDLAPWGDWTQQELFP